MRFTAVYRNDGNIRTEALKLIYSAINNKMDLGAQPFQHPIVNTMPNLMNWSHFASLPLGFQCEHMEYVSGNLITLNLMVLDTDVKPEPVDNKTAS